MKKIYHLSILFSVFFFPLLAFSESVLVPIHLVSTTGVGSLVGQIELSDTKEGLKILPKIEHLPVGQRAIHIHENPSCDAGLKEGVATAALAAGSHFDPNHSGKHLGPSGAGHHGDLPVIEVDSAGKATVSVLAPHLKLSQIHKRSIVIHEGGDNYSDTPKPLGGAGARIACGVIP
jgi:Cu-Zn family superoxide dismutase